MKAWEELLSWRLKTAPRGESKCFVPIGDLSTDEAAALVGRVNTWSVLHFPPGTLLIESIYQRPFGMEMKVSYAPYGWNTEEIRDYKAADFRMIPDREMPTLPEGFTAKDLIAGVMIQQAFRGGAN